MNHAVVRLVAQHRPPQILHHSPAVRQAAVVITAGAADQDADGQVWLVYEDPAAMVAGLDIPADAEVVGKMQGALANLTGAAAN